MGFQYAVIGAGRQGTAAAYDMVKFGDADEVRLADVRLLQARHAATRVNRLAGARLARALPVDVSDSAATRRILEGVDVCLSAVPYFFNLDLTRAAIESGVSMVDLGGNTEIVRKQLMLDPKAREAGVSVIPDCGMGPGLNITLAVYAIDLLDVPRHVFIYDGGLPVRPEPPWDYALTFNIEGLTNEYDGDAVFLREGELVRVPALSERELIEVPPLGLLEAAVTSGGLSTAPWTFRGKLTTLQNKTLRYPGHWDRIAVLRDLGLFRQEPVMVDGHRTIPRHLFHALFEPQVRPKEIEDICVERIRALGLKDGEDAEVVVDLIDRFDSSTGFTAMERLTGWHAAIAAEMIARGAVAPGVHSVESGLPGRPFVDEVRRRRISIEERITFHDGTSLSDRWPRPVLGPAILH